MNDTTEVLGTVFCDVVEKMAFMFSDEFEEGASPAGVRDAIRAFMEFRGPIEGTIALAVAKDLCPEIAANSLGLEPDDEDAISKSDDALKELLNVICGNFLTRVSGDEPIFDLTVPQVEDLDPEQWDALAQREGTCSFLVEDYPALIRVDVDT